jgi:aspartate aminotransferase-like enzyme
MVIPAEHASPVTTAVWSLPGMDVHDYLDWLRRERGLRLGGGFGALADRSFRVGHMGRAAEPAVVDAYLEATAVYVADRGLG